MIAPHGFQRSRWLAPSSAIALAALYRVLGCATIVEEPSSSVDTTQSPGPVSNSNSISGGVTLTSSSAATLDSSTTTGGSTTGAALATSTTTAGGSSVTTAESSIASSSGSSTVTSATASNNTTGSNTAVTTGGSTTSSNVTGGTGGAGGATASTSATASTESSSTTGGSTEFCDDARTPAQNAAAEGNTGSFGTLDGVCFRLDFVPAAFAGWGCSNFAASAGNRTIVVNGTHVTCGEVPLPAPVDGGYYFDFGPGTNATAAMYWWNWQ